MGLDTTVALPTSVGKMAPGRNRTFPASSHHPEQIQGAQSEEQTLHHGPEECEWFCANSPETVPHPTGLTQGGGVAQGLPSSARPLCLVSQLDKLPFYHH